MLPSFLYSFYNLGKFAAKAAMNFRHAQYTGKIFLFQGLYAFLRFIILKIGLAYFLILL